jgi:hypothetical protein
MSAWTLDAAPVVVGAAATVKIVTVERELVDEDDVVELLPEVEDEDVRGAEVVPVGAPDEVGNPGGVEVGAVVEAGLNTGARVGTGGGRTGLGKLNGCCAPEATPLYVATESPGV